MRTSSNQWSCTRTSNQRLPYRSVSHYTTSSHTPFTVDTPKATKSERKALAGVSSHKSCRYKTHVQTLLLLFYVQSSSKAPGPDHAFKIAGLFWERNFVTIYLLLIYVFFFFFFRHVLYGVWTGKVVGKSRILRRERAFAGVFWARHLSPFDLT